MMPNDSVGLPQEYIVAQEFTVGGDDRTSLQNREYRISTSEPPVLELGNLNELDVLNLLNDQGVTADMPTFDLDDSIGGGEYRDV